MPILQPFKLGNRLSKTEQFPANFSAISGKFPGKNDLSPRNDTRLMPLVRDYESFANEIRANHELIGVNTKQSSHPNIYLCDCAYAKTFRLAELGIIFWEVDKETRKYLVDNGMETLDWRI